MPVISIREVVGIVNAKVAVQGQAADRDTMDASRCLDVPPITEASVSTEDIAPWWLPVRL